MNSLGPCLNWMFLSTAMATALMQSEAIFGCMSQYGTVEGGQREFGILN